MTTAASRPNRPGALNTSDLTYDRRVRWHYGKSHIDLQIKGEPFETRRGRTKFRWIRVKDLSTGQMMTMTLSSLGTEPYDDGEWSVDNYVTAAP